MDDTREVCRMLKQAGTYFLATDDGGQPQVRPFGTAHLYNGRLYFLTAASKAVSSQLHSRPHFAICAMIGRDWLRMTGRAILDPDPEACVSLLEEYPGLKRRYAPGDGNVELWYMEGVTATLYSYTAPPKSWRF